MICGIGGNIRDDFEDFLREICESKVDQRMRRKGRSQRKGEKKTFGTIRGGIEDFEELFEKSFRLCDLFEELIKVFTDEIPQERRGFKLNLGLWISQQPVEDSHHRSVPHFSITEWQFNKKRRRKRRR